MFSLKMTINGKPATQSNIKSTLEQAVFNSAIEQIKEKISKSITSAEASKITIDVKGNDIGSLKINVSGPDEIVNKVKKVLS